MAIYMNYSVGGTAIAGDVTTDGYQNWIELQSFQWGVGRGVSSAQGAGGNREGSTPSVSEIAVTKEEDQSTGPLLKEAYTGIGSSTVTITFVRTGTPPVAFLSYILTNVMLSGFSTSAGSSGAPSESLSLNFTRIEIDVTATDGTGTALPMYPVTYDLQLQNTV